eukprot:2712714-Pyramimonas_sp.AAC.1
MASLQPMTDAKHLEALASQLGANKFFTRFAAFSRYRRRHDEIYHELMPEVKERAKLEYLDVPDKLILGGTTFKEYNPAMRQHCRVRLDLCIVASRE